MDFPPPKPSRCSLCGDETVSITTVCGPCHVRASVAFWAWIDGRGSLHDFYESLKPPQRLSDGPVFPLPGDVVSCGLRTDVPKINRRHLWAYMGMDTRNLGDKGFWDVEVYACTRCGRDAKGSSHSPGAVSRMG